MQCFEWTNLPKPLNVFTQCNTTMRELGSGKVVQHYSANTKIVLVQKAVFGNKTYYRTTPAKEKGLNWAFEASAFGLPNDGVALLANSYPPENTLLNSETSQETETKQKSSQNAVPSKSRETERRMPFWRKWFHKT